MERVLDYENDCRSYFTRMANTLANHTVNRSANASDNTANNTRNTEESNASRDKSTNNGNATRSYNASTANNADSYNTSVTNSQNEKRMENDNASNTYNVTVQNAERDYSKESRNIDRTRSTAGQNATNTRNTAQAIASDTRATARANAQRDYDVGVAGIQAGLNQAALEAPRQFGEFSNGDTSVTRPQGIFCNIVTQSKDAIEQTGDYWLRFGYMVNRAWKFEGFNLMPHFTFWKVKDMWIAGNNVPDAYLDEIRFSLMSGVCVWRDPHDIGRISIYENA